MNHLVGFGSLVPGLRLRAIEYHRLSFEADAAGDDVDAVSMAVVVDFGASGVARFHWRLDPGTEDLWVGPWQPGDPATEVRRHDATSRWGLSGALLVGKSLAFQLTDRQRSPTPWSCRLAFDHDRSLVIALGELRPDGGIAYIPDNLVVTDSRRLATGYWPTSSRSSSWGVEVES